MRNICLSVFALAALITMPASACSLIEVPEAQKAEHQRQFDLRFLEEARAAEAIVRVRIVRADGYKGTARITDVLRKKPAARVAIGQRFELNSRSGSVCGIGTIPANGEGVLLYNRGEQREFMGFVDPRLVEFLREQKLIG